MIALNIRSIPPRSSIPRRTAMKTSQTSTQSRYTIGRKTYGDPQKMNVKSLQELLTHAEGLMKKATNLASLSATNETIKEIDRLDHAIIQLKVQIQVRKENRIV